MTDKITPEARHAVALVNALRERDEALEALRLTTNLMVKCANILTAHEINPFVGGGMTPYELAWDNRTILAKHGKETI